MSNTRKQPPWIVITGGPCSGKTTLFEEITGSITGVLGIPELATVLTRDIGVLRSEDPLIYRKPLWQMQRIVESSFFHMAEALDDVRAVILDSASVCNAAFLQGGRRRMEEMFRTSLATEYPRYDHVIWLPPAPRNVFERDHKRNPQRIESYSLASEIGYAMFEAWTGHPNFRPIIPCDFDDWPAKSALATEHILHIVGSD